MTARPTSRQSSYDTRDRRSRSKSLEFHIPVVRRAPVNKKKIPRQQIQSLIVSTKVDLIGEYKVDLIGEYKVNLFSAFF